jgi:3-methyl-2-oxobutanoate hydroxymethyltransferase
MTDAPPTPSRVAVTDLQAWKREGERFCMLTAYDYTTARILSEAGIPVLLVGDSLGMVMLGYRTTLPVTMAEMLHHARAVARAAPERLLIGDMPFSAYQGSDEQAITNAVAFLQAGMNAIKIEGGGRIAGLTETLVERGIPVMAHLGLTPQFVNLMGGYRVQGRKLEVAERILADARALESAGAFAIVLEGMPGELAGRVTAAIGIPTIGIGAGAACDGQVLVGQDLLGLTPSPSPTFVKRYAELGAAAGAAAAAFAADVKAGRFPDEEHSYH